MAGRFRLMVIVFGVSAFAAACGGTESSVLGPSVTPTASSAPAGPGGGAALSGVVRVRCEQESGRSKVSVDGNNVRPGAYQARIVSGANNAAAPARASAGDEVEFDFDSNPNDVAAGAIRIPAGFIQDGRVQGDLLDASGALVATATADCTTR